MRDGADIALRGATTDQAPQGSLELGSVGPTVWLEREELIDVVTAVSGSGPAYFFRLMELLEEAGRGLGLPAEVARTLSIETTARYLNARAFTIMGGTSEVQTNILAKTLLGL